MGISQNQTNSIEIEEQQDIVEKNKEDIVENQLSMFQEMPIEEFNQEENPKEIKSQRKSRLRILRKLRKKLNEKKSNKEKESSEKKETLKENTVKFFGNVKNTFINKIDNIKNKKVELEEENRENEVIEEIIPEIDSESEIEIEDVKQEDIIQEQELANSIDDEKRVLVVVDAEKGYCRIFSKEYFTEKLIRGIDKSDNNSRAHYSSKELKLKREFFVDEFQLTIAQAERIDPVIFSALTDYDRYLWEARNIRSNKAENYAICMAKDFEIQSDEDEKEHLVRCQRQRKIELENYDLEIDASDISLELANELKLLEPFGACNEEPIFKIRTKITNASLMGKANDHLRLKAKSLDNINSFDMVGFFMGDKFEHIVYDKEYLSCGTININEFMGNKKIQFMLNDITNNDEDHIRNEYYKSKYNLVMSKFDGKMQVSLVEGITEDIYNDKDFVNSVDNFNDFDKLINNTDNLESPVKIMVLDKLDNLINIKKMYGDKVEIYYNNLDEKIAQNCIIKDKKPLIVLANNIVKFVDLRKNYTIIYSDSLDSFKNKEVEAIFGVLKDDVIMTYKRLLYLDKTSNNEVYFDDFLYNLKELDLYKVLLSIEILNELNIITSEINLDNEKVSFNINEGVKNPIENSKLFARYKI